MKPTEFKGIYAGESSIRIDFMLNGERCRETIRGTPTKTRLKEAALKRDQIQYEIDMGKFDYLSHFPNSPRALRHTPNKAAHITISQSVDIWFKHKSKNWTQATYRGNLSKVRTHVLPNFGQLTLAEFKPSMFKLWASSSTLSPKSINAVRSIMLGIFKEQFNDCVIDSNPIEKCEPLPKRTKRVTPFNPEQREAIIDAIANPIARDFYIFAFSTGLRTGEQLGLRWQDVDFEKKRIYIRQSIVNGKLAGTKTDSSNRTHHLDDEALQVLLNIQQYHPSNQPEERVFINPANMKPWKDDAVPRNRHWKPALKRAGVPYQRPYTCRHTYASTKLTAGCDPSWLAKQMGHKDWGMIRTIYAQWID
ncbi:tyrosine-type recombinase/integrase [Rheinheimera sp.]|uniref:tyrosine-type recombinase/integrase n=1 Tax=Rheinheimera sp. TaxID=1869214 RepID=UPI002FDEE44F